jgi:hypothetical protein
VGERIRVHVVGRLRASEPSCQPPIAVVTGKCLPSVRCRRWRTKISPGTKETSGRVSVWPVREAAWLL